MQRGTLELKHQNMLADLDSSEQIEYLLNVADLLEQYGAESLNNNSTVAHAGDSGRTVDEFVNVVTTSSNGALYTRYLSAVHGEVPEPVKLIDSYICATCKVGKLSVGTDAHMICPNCGATDIYFDSGAQGMSYDQEVNSEVNTSFAYKRINHFNEWIAQFQAKEAINITESVLNDIRAEFKKSRTNSRDITQTKVKAILKKLKQSKLYEHIAIITNILNGINPPKMTAHLEEQLRTMFKDIQEPFERNKPKTRSNFLSYSYCLYKFCELLNKDEFLPCFHLLKSRERLHQQDCIWKKICADMHWGFIPTV